MTETLPLIGSKEGLSHLPLAVINPGDVAIVPEPGYQAYLGGSLLAGAEPHVVPLRPENGFLLELDQDGRTPDIADLRARLLSALEVLGFASPRLEIRAAAPLHHTGDKPEPFRGLRPPR